MLGKLEKVELKTIWETEAQGFTPWLAEAANLELLGEAIGIELELEAQEKDVGPFRADLLCKNTEDNSWVLIENQIEKTDHKHLGQLLTYAAGLQAVTIVWVASRFTEEHRAALDWLNEKTDDNLRFFGLEVELWKINNSPAAPKFNVISKPNNWSKAVSRVTKNIDEESAGEAKILQYNYWQKFVDYLRESGSKLRLQEPRAQHWQPFSIGRSGFRLAALLNTRESRIGIHLVINCGEDTKPFYNLLAQDKAAIESEIGTELEWRENPDKTESKILLFKDVNLDNESDWKPQHEWLKKMVEKFDASFRKRLRNLNISS